MLSIPPLHSSALEAACPFALHQLAGYFAFVRGIFTPLCLEVPGRDGTLPTPGSGTVRGPSSAALELSVVFADR